MTSNLKITDYNVVVKYINIVFVNMTVTISEHVAFLNLNQMVTCNTLNLLKIMF